MGDRMRLGGKVRALRRREGLTQAALAERLDISPSYLALIEGDKRPLTARLLIALAQQFDIDLTTFADDDDDRLAADLIEGFSDPLFEEHPLSAPEVREMVRATPTVARAALTLFRAWKAARDQIETLAASAAMGQSEGSADLALSNRLPAEEVSDALQRFDNHFPALEAAAEGLRAGLDGARTDLVGALVRHLEGQRIDVRVETVGAMAGTLRRYEPAARRLRLSESLSRSSLTFQLAHQAGLLAASETLDGLVQKAAPGSPTARTLYRVALANYFAAAVMMPYGPMLAAARDTRYDIELLMHRFGASWEQVCHRLTTLRRKEAAGLAFHLIRVDIAGNISKRFSASGIRFARFSGACPRWNVHAAFLTPGRIRTQVSQMDDGSAYFCVARTVERGGAGWRAPRTTLAVGLGVRLADARAMIYAADLDPERALETAVPVGTTCRLCPRTDCAQRAMPPLAAPLEVDPHVRGLSFYARPNPKSAWPGRADER